MSNAKFDKALRYFVKTTCLTPIRTGGSERDTQQILRYHDGTPFLQGTSLAGAWKAWRPDRTLLGDENTESALIISDLVFDASEMDVRPRLRIDGRIGSVDGDQKFDVAALPAGTEGAFQLVWRGNEDKDMVAELIETYLAAMNAGQITLGAQKSNGFGRVSLYVKRRDYLLTDPEDLAQWLNGDQVQDAKEITLSPASEKQTVFSVSARVGNLLIKDSAGQGVGEGSLKAVQMRDINGNIVIPGSSLKGAIWAHAVRIAPHIGFPGALSDLFGRESNGDDNGVAGQVVFGEGVLLNPGSHDYARIHINRFTGGVIGSGLFREEFVSGRLEFEIRLPAGEMAGCALILYALRDLGLGLYELGSGTAIGRGRLEQLQVTVRSGEMTGRLCCDSGSVMIEDSAGLIRAWQAALKRRDQA